MTRPIGSGRMLPEICSAADTEGSVQISHQGLENTYKTDTFVMTSNSVGGEEQFVVVTRKAEVKNRKPEDHIAMVAARVGAAAALGDGKNPLTEDGFVGLVQAALIHFGAHQALLEYNPREAIDSSFFQRNPTFGAITQDEFVNYFVKLGKSRLVTNNRGAGSSTTH